MVQQMAVTRPEQDSPVDNTNHDLIHTLSVRLDSQWHDRAYEAETRCEGCRSAFERLRAMDREAIQILTREISNHFRTNRFPLDLTD